MPRVAPLARPWIFQRMKLEASFSESYALAVGDEFCTIRGYDVRHPPTLPHMPMQPEATFHSVDHTFLAPSEFTNVELVVRRAHLPAHAHDVCLLAGQLSF